jgi:hypothetical protein
MSKMRIQIEKGRIQLNIIPCSCYQSIHGEYRKIERFCPMAADPNKLDNNDFSTIIR